MSIPFRDRRDAGRQLAAQLSHYRDEKDVIVLALPRGGVPVAYEIARALDAPLDVFLVRKLGVPGFEELAMGAIASGNILFLNQDVIRGNDIEVPLRSIEIAEPVWRGMPKPTIDRCFAAVCPRGTCATGTWPTLWSLWPGI